MGSYFYACDRHRHMLEKYNDGRLGMRDDEEERTVIS